MRNSFGVFKTTILGGVIFLLPFGVVLFLIGQAVNVVMMVADPLAKYLPNWSAGGASLAIVLATVLVIGVCYLAGLAARRSLAARYAEKMEKALIFLFPRYAILKDRMAGNLGGAVAPPHLKPVLVKFDDASRIGFEVERTAEGEALKGAIGLVTVYLPGAPDPWMGHVVHVPAGQVEPLAADFAQTVAICETLGRQASQAIGGAGTAEPNGPRAAARS